MAQQDHWLPGFNFDVGEWDAGGCSRKILGCAGLWDRGNTAKPWRGYDRGDFALWRGAQAGDNIKNVTAKTIIYPEEVLWN
jgi:hypothetical protein